MGQTRYEEEVGQIRCEKGAGQMRCKEVGQIKCEMGVWKMGRGKEVRCGEWMWTCCS